MIDIWEHNIQVGLKNVKIEYPVKISKLNK